MCLWVSLKMELLCKFTLKWFLYLWAATSKQSSPFQLSFLSFYQTNIPLLVSCWPLDHISHKIQFFLHFFSFWTLQSFYPLLLHTKNNVISSLTCGLHRTGIKPLTIIWCSFPWSHSHFENQLGSIERKPFRLLCFSKTSCLFNCFHENLRDSVCGKIWNQTLCSRRDALELAHFTSKSSSSLFLF